MKFSLDASGAQAMGNGIGSIFKAMAMAPMMRQQAEQNAALRNARTYGANMAGNKYGAEAEKERFTLDQRQAPIDEAMPQYLQTAQRLFQMTGDTNAERVAKAGTAVQTQGIRDQALAAVDDLDRMNRLNTLAKPGAQYMPMRAVGDTGRAINQATGESDILDAILAKLFDNVKATNAQANVARANASNASAGNSSASAALTRAEMGFLEKNGHKPGSGREASEGALSSTLMRTLQVPAVDQKGRVVRNPITGEAETTTDLDALNRYYGWAASNNRKPTATSFMQWEAAGRPDAGGGTAPAAPAAPGAKPASGGNASALDAARAAIAKGAPRDKVIERLRQNGINPEGL